MEEIEYDIFISYSRKDYVDENNNVKPNNIVSQIKAALNENNITYWIDENGIFSGDEFAKVIAQYIRKSHIFLFISTENSNASEWTSDEIATARIYKKKIIPFKYDDSFYNEQVIIFIAKLDYIDYPSNPSQALDKLVRSIKVYLEEQKKNSEKEIIKIVTDIVEKASELSKEELSKYVYEKLKSVSQFMSALDNPIRQFVKKLVSSITSLSENPSASDKDKTTFRNPANQIKQLEGKGIKDNTHYSINGEGNYGKGPLIYEVIKRYIDKKGYIDIDDLQKVFHYSWRGKTDSLSNMIVIDQTQYNNEVRDFSNRNWRWKELKMFNSVCYINNQWGTKAGMQKIINKIRGIGLLKDLDIQEIQ
jgi:hypothetical protein